MEEVLLTCDASMDDFDHEQKFSELTLVLTEKLLYIIKEPNSIMPIVLLLPINQIVIPCQRHNDPSLITITIHMSAQVIKKLIYFIIQINKFIFYYQNDTTYARVADYVRKSQSFLNMETNTIPDNPDQTHKLFVSPQIRNHVLNVIEFLKRHTLNKGYAVI